MVTRSTMLFDLGNEVHYTAACAAVSSLPLSQLLRKAMSSSAPP